jgi:hypothetical protein
MKEQSLELQQQLNAPSPWTRLAIALFGTGVALLVVGALMR